jgi:lipase chaperone LimK
MGPCVVIDGDIDRLAALLELTDEQKDEVAGLVTEWQEQNAQVVERARKFHEERESLWSSAERPRRQAMMELAEKYDYPMRELAPKCQEFRESVGEMLTADQRAILERPGRRPRGPR